MSKISATDFIKKFNPNNTSGTVKSSLDMLQNLKKSKGLIPAFQAVGPEHLLGVLQDVMKRIKQEEKEAIEEVEKIVTKVQEAIKNV
jgi:hypothetical protein